jgi:EAL domain-containing protein (putative c-di-GMP-specific phosphodiesterase class I)
LYCLKALPRELFSSVKTNFCQSTRVARLGGDEFAILLDDLHSPSEAIEIAKRLQQSISKPLKIAPHELYPSVSVGIALSSLDYQTVEEIIRDADTAMYHAKNTGRARFVVFDTEMHKKAIDLLRLDSDLRRAVDQQQLELYYQPIVSLQKKVLVGFEALLRWNHPENGLISPDVFIPMAEETNLIYQIGQWVLSEACQQLSQWKANSAIRMPLSMHVNISSKQLTETRLIDRLIATVRAYNIAPSELKLEVTESNLMENTHHSLKLLNQLNQFGFKLGIDDFGTGYSSLSYLNKFPVDTLKVDRSFVSQIDKSENNTSISITNSIITLAHSLGVKVVAEGIEGLYHLAWLQQQKCDYGQGFLFSKPLPAAEATRLAEKGLDWPWKC